MFESSLHAALVADTEVTGHVSTYGSRPAIFSDFAPEGAQKPYITFRITESDSGHPAIKQFMVYVDYWDYNKSRTDAREAVQAIEFALDRTELEHDRYKCIRLFWYSAGMVDEEDPREIHHNTMFIARAGRKAWADQL
jgi:hypothetical protein